MSDAERIDYPFVSKKATEDESIDDLEGGWNTERVCQEGEKCECKNGFIGRVDWKANGTADAGKVRLSAEFTFDSRKLLPSLEGWGEVENSRLVRGELKEQGGQQRTILVEKCNPKRWSVA